VLNKVTVRDVPWRPARLTGCEVKVSVSLMGFFDRWAPNYDRLLQRVMFEPVHEAALDAFSAVSGLPREVVDVGCGTGRLLEAAGRRWSGARLTGIDVSEAMIAEARRKFKGDARFSFKQGDACALQLRSAFFDAAFSTYSFHYWRDQASGIREVARVLQPGGFFVLADVDPPLLFVTNPLLMWIDGLNFRHPEDIRRLLEQAELAVLTAHRFCRLGRVQLFVARKKQSG
jgi:ubiquinone/menaquinone biosynthesis C-methylase UbiE